MNSWEQAEPSGEEKPKEEELSRSLSLSLSLTGRTHPGARNRSPKSPNMRTYFQDSEPNERTDSLQANGHGLSPEIKHIKRQTSNISPSQSSTWCLAVCLSPFSLLAAQPFAGSLLKRRIASWTSDGLAPLR